jgi:glycosyltransferase involved in cell wall biosynthesis
MTGRASPHRQDRPLPTAVYQRQKEARRKVQRTLYHSAMRAIERYQRPRPKIPISNRSSKPTVYFLTPDYNIPAGGVRVMYRHVDLLNEAGIDAAVLHQGKGFRCTWFDNTTRVTDIRSSAVGPDDTLVVCELDVDIVAELQQPIRHLVLNQSGYLTWAQRGNDVAKHYASSADLIGVIVVSDYSARMLAYAYPGMTIRRIRNGIDHTRFYPPSGLKERRISYHPRRGRRELEHVIHMLRARGVLQNWELFPLDGLNQEDFAAGLRSSRIYLSLSCWEGFGLTSCEAMASGSYVIGFHGFGGQEFMRPEFSCPVETDDVIAVAEAVEKVIAADSADEQWCGERGRLASSFVLDQYSEERERHSVVSAYRDLLGI